MTKHWPQAYVLISGLIFLALGLVTLIHPGILVYYEIGATSPAARVALRAMIGGGELAISALLLAGRALSLTTDQRCWIAATIFFFVAAARMIGIVLDDGLVNLSQPLREGAIEAALAIVGFMAGSAWRKSVLTAVP